MRYLPILISTVDDKDRSRTTRLSLAIRVTLMIIAAVLLFGGSVAVEPTLARNYQRALDRTNAEQPQTNVNPAPDTTVTMPRAAPAGASPAGSLNRITGQKPDWWKKNKANRKPSHLRYAQLVGCPSFRPLQ